MLVINSDNSIYITRGDVANIEVSATNAIGEDYVFQPGELVRFKVFKRRNCADIVLQKDVVVEEEAKTVCVYLGKGETKFGDIINKPVEYWYEIELNPDTAPQTIIGYDKDGEKVLKLFPEGGDFLNE